MPTYKLSILSPAGKAFDGNAESVVAPGREGQMGVLAGHAPMIAALQPGVSTVVADGQKTFVYTGEGVIEVSRTEVVLLVDEAQRAETIDAAHELHRQRLERDRVAATEASA
jgi:F-type H+-transporting ATPase subunit epsilon